MFSIPLQCINEAAIEFHVPAKLIISVLEIEQGKIGKISKNSNGTYDIGPLQINSIWLPTLKNYGISQEDIQFDACTNIKVGAWILSKAIANQNDLLKGIGDYHSHTYQFNKNYYNTVRVNFTKINLLFGEQK